jgi:hypothetical protein
VIRAQTTAYRRICPEAHRGSEIKVTAPSGIAERRRRPPGVVQRGSAMDNATVQGAQLSNTSTASASAGRRADRYRRVSSGRRACSPSPKLTTAFSG